MRKKEKELLKTICENEEARKFILIKLGMLIPIFAMAFVGILELFTEPFVLTDIVVGILAAGYALWFFIELIVFFYVAGNTINKE